MDNIQPLAIDGNNLDRPIIISGPCSAETEEQVLETARGLARAGVKVYRAGIWKPRTKPGGFEGVGVPGLAWLNKVKEETGMKVATEVANRGHVEAALEYGVDLLWVGARTSANPFAMQEIADVLREAGKDIPVLVKNPVNPDLELWIGALERLYNAGITRLGVIHRGFSTYGKQLYRNHPQWRIPLELRIRYPHLPIICDPSHIGGKRELIASLSQQALDMGFDGLIIESHCDPDCAWSDKNQQITPEVLSVILDNLVFRDAPVPTDSLVHLRRQIDQLDNELLEVLGKRMNVSREIGAYKRDHNMPVVQATRYGDIMTSRILAAKSMGMSEDFMRQIFSSIHEESVRIQVDLNK
ncbi:MAG: bifunctional 3-deoxy-7-phosphoheptulonate synthase/chorismate mutase type II [Duncaniella sp.]|nr:bifunctional 3-deoxy-7-phosphoheptulonate synthase/chorismate mutase type II [Duncaniella sp.]MDE6328264.1 bifunctional 3-deoxy-7-phosphoheptulonate synthase/chorismate mutase type II [Duncaniella sp.]MDE6466437.1 bifunctional 3-deoxy-7-phosphoheptulonate synthase/chorismate mutase type II [Duncaniella sp.]